MPNNNGNPLCTEESYEVVRQHATALDENHRLVLVQHYRTREPYLAHVVDDLSDKVINHLSDTLDELAENTKLRAITRKELGSLKDILKDEFQTLVLYGYMIHERLAAVKFGEDFAGQFDFLSNES